MPLDLAAHAIPRSLVVLMLSPHPDDFDTIAAAMRLLHLNGNAVHVAVARGGSGVDDDCCTPPTFAAKAALRDREQEASCRLFGLPDGRLVFLTLENGPDDQMLDSPANHEAVARHVQTVQPDLVFLPHGNDHNSAHQAMCRIARGIAAAAKRPMLLFLNRDPKTSSMRVDAFLPFDERVAQWKRALLRCHDSQQRRNIRVRGNGFDDRILDMNARDAKELSLAMPYAEVFDLECGSHAAAFNSRAMLGV